jgi:hypothetical protein
MPHGGTETTDRVLQWTLWDLQLSGAIAGQSGAGLRFNVNQVGSAANNFNSTTTIEVHPNGVIDVWYKPDLQWNTGLQNQFGENMSALTRYELAADGVIKVKHMIMVSSSTSSSQTTPTHTASIARHMGQLVICWLRRRSTLFSKPHSYPGLRITGLGLRRFSIARAVLPLTGWLSCSRL